MSSALLDVENLTMRFGGLIAIDDLSFSAKKDHITSIIGPNGAGKTTVFNCLTGFYKATAGSMYLNKENNKMDLKKFSDFKVAQKAGVARTFQNIRLFPQMSHRPSFPTQPSPHPVLRPPLPGSAGRCRFEPFAVL